MSFHRASFDFPKSDRPEFIATIWSEHANGERGLITITGRTQHELDQNVIEEIGNVRSRGHRPVKTEMKIGGDEWVYEYATDGTVELIHRNGSVQP